MFVVPQSLGHLPRSFGFLKLQPEWVRKLRSWYPQKSHQQTMGQASQKWSRMSGRDRSGCGSGPPSRATEDMIQGAQWRPLSLPLIPNPSCRAAGRSPLDEKDSVSHLMASPHYTPFQPGHAEDGAGCEPQNPSPKHRSLAVLGTFGNIGEKAGRHPEAAALTASQPQKGFSNLSLIASLGPAERRGLHTEPPPHASAPGPEEREKTGPTGTDSLTPSLPL